MRTNLRRHYGGWILKGAIATTLALLVNGCAPASSRQYAMHLSASHEPNQVNVDAYTAAQRLYGEPQAGAVLAGAMADEPSDHR
jgi:hypothetical protein